MEITTPLSPHLEMTEITDRVTKAKGPALLFTRRPDLKSPCSSTPTARAAHGPGAGSGPCG